MLIKYNTFLLIYIFKTNLSKKNFKKKKKNNDTKQKKKKKKPHYMRKSTCNEACVCIYKYNIFLYLSCYKNNG